MKPSKLYFALRIFVLTTFLASQVPQAYAGKEIPGVFDCELAFRNQKTTSFLVACADGYEKLTGIKWARWDTNSARGRGQYLWNDCKPSCVDGKTHSIQVMVVLSRVKTVKNHLFFTAIEWWQIDAKGVKVKSGRSGGWDLFQNFKDMGGTI